MNPLVRPGPGVGAPEVTACSHYIGEASMQMPNMPARVLLVSIVTVPTIAPKKLRGLTAPNEIGHDKKLLQRLPV